MDPLGKKGEKAFEAVENVSGRMEELESRINALDSALQDFQSSSRELLHEDLDVERKQIGELRELDSGAASLEDVERLGDRIEELERNHGDDMDRIEELIRDDLLEALKSIGERVKLLGRETDRISKNLTELEEKVNRMEDEFILEANRREYDFDQKLDKSEFEKEKSGIQEELRKLRTSINVLADDLDRKEDIETG